MNLTFLFIFFIIMTIINDFFTDKLDVMENEKIKVSHTISNFISTMFTYLVVTLVFAVVFRYALVPEEYNSCFNNCHVLINNTIIGVIALIIQIINIYNFYECYIHSYRYFACHSKLLEKIIIAIMGLTTVIFNEFLLSIVNLNILSFDQSILNILIKVVSNSTIIFMIVLIIIREIDRFVKNRHEQDV